MARETARIRLVCIDVDGTLIGAAGVVDSDVWYAVERVRAAGIHLAISSGRPGFGVTRELAERIDRDGWHSFQNGASVVNMATGSSLSAQLPPAAVDMLVSRARDTGRLLELYSDDDYAFVGESGRSREHAALLGVPFERRTIESLHGPMVRALWLVPLQEAEAVLAEPHPGLETSRSTSPMMPDTCFINMTREGVDKGSAVRAMAAEYCVTLEEVMYVGDGHNDAAAMRLVGCPVAMGNADFEAKAAAVRTVAHVDEGGLVEALELATEWCGRAR
ncbi:MAG TPA: HAD family hydrolase [Gemmatimonadaceae bacterium]|jgi:HAD-superfamily hydrolase, subfamily IIB